jgi:hypothetical protein
LRLRLPAATDHAETPGAVAGEVLRRDPARGAGAALAECIGLEHCGERAALELEQADHEGELAADDRVGLQPRIAEPAIGRRHDRERPLVELEPPPRHVLDYSRVKTAEALLDHRHRVPGRQEAFDVCLGEVERHRASLSTW